MSLLRFKAVRRIVDNRSRESVATTMRRKRMVIFSRLIHDLDPPVRVLDVGGTEAYWLAVGIPGEIRIVLLNRASESVRPVTPGVEAVSGDARDLSQFSDRQFDVVFSNSVIEHVGSFVDQKAMAREVQRVGRTFFVQTPNRYFPIEPHFLLPGFQFLPLGVQAWLHSKWNLGWMRRAEGYQAARRAVQRLRLLDRSELQELFPSASIYVERFAGIPKSYIAHGRSGPL